MKVFWTSSIGEPALSPEDILLIKRTFFGFSQGERRHSTIIVKN